MMLDDATLYRLAGLSAVVAVVALIISGIALALFFGGAGEFWGPVNDVFIALTLLALILPMLAVDRLAGPSAGTWLRVVTVAAIAGAVLGAAGQLLLVAGVIDLETSFVTGGLGIVPVLVWFLALVILAFGPGTLPAAVGWLAAGTLSLIVVGSIVSAITLGPVSWVAWTAVLLVLAASIWSLGTILSGRVAA